MKKYVTIALLAAILMSTAVYASTTTKEVRWPQKGDAFVTFYAPGDWLISVDAKHNTLGLRPPLMTKDTLQSVAIGYEEHKPVALTSKNFRDIVDSIMGGLNADKAHEGAFLSRKVVRIAGFNWNRFTTDIVSNKITLHTSIYLCTDATRIISVAFMNAGPRFSDQERRLLSSVKVNGMKSCALNDAK